MAAEDKYITTATNISVIGSDISIETYYVEDSGSDITFFIAADNLNENSVDFLQGELGYTNVDFSGSFDVDEDGNLTVFSAEADNLLIDADGNLILTLN